MHRTGALYGQFKTLEQQKDTASLGMWIFLVTEVMFFGGIMLAYTINRHTYFHAFAMGSNTLSIKLGGFNTVVLLASSFTMAMAVWSSQTGKKKLISMFLTLTIILGFVFFGVKYIEYAQKFHHHLVPGRSFDITYCVNNPSKCEDMDAAETGCRAQGTRRCHGRRSGPECPRAALLFRLLRHDRLARAAHGHRRRAALLAAAQLAVPEFTRRSGTRPWISWACTGTSSILSGFIFSRCYI